MVLSELSQMSLSSSSWDSSESPVKISTVAAFLPLPAACPRKWRFPGPAWLQRVMALTTSACDYSFSEAPLLHTVIKSCRLCSSRATRFLSFRRFSSEKPRSTVAVWLGRTSTTCRRTCSSGNRARPSRNLPMSSRKDFGQQADGPTKSNQSSHSSLSCSSGAHSTLLRASVPHGQDDLWGAGQSHYLRLTKIIQILWSGNRVMARRVLRLGTCGRLGWKKDLDVLSIFFVVRWAGRVWLIFRRCACAKLTLRE